MKRILFLLIFLMISCVAFSQNGTEEQLGIQYFQNKEYDKAVEIFEKIYNKNTNSYIYYYYCRSLIELQDYKEAEKLIKKQIRAFPDASRYKVELGYIYELDGDGAKAQKEYANLLQNLSAKESEIRELYGAYLTVRQTEFAIETLKKGRKLLKNNKFFSAELTSIYTQLNQPEKVIEEALTLVEDNGYDYLPQSEQIIQNLLTDDESGQNYNLVSTILKKEVQKYPDNSCYFQLLYWVYRINKNFSEAFVLAKALDKREKGEGSIVYQLGIESSRNRDYIVAIDCFNYVVAKGSKSSYFTDAQFELLNTKYSHITSISPVKLVDAIALEKDFKKLLDEYGSHSGTSDWVRKYAHLLAFYVNKPDDAVALLEKTVTNPELRPMEKAFFKTDLADIELYRGNVWDATLLYSQVDKDFPNDTIGQLAKYKNAKLSFYIGEFNWAKNQLDVLKAATTKLIANDAMYFSLVISDNEEEEEEEDAEEGIEVEESVALFSETVKNLPLNYFAKADFLRFQNKDAEAMKMLDSAQKAAPVGPLVDDIYYQKAKILIKQGNFIKAEEYLKLIVENFGEEILGDDATFLLAQLYEYHFKDITKAMEYYQQVMKNYPGSLYVVDARKHFRVLRGDH
ncbi:MAG: tetratricopeptide repeat protein [Bacteroidales bacterium]|jgi:tetratricopeptide (TPR) repeat protein|nr:tetratricopeptide repeat protein [Bacteroidales bacterium]